MVRAIRLLKAGSQCRKNDSVLFYLLKKQIRAVAENAHHFFYALSKHFLDGLSGLSPVFQTFYIQVWNKYDTLVPHPAYIYFIKMPANPDNPSRFVFFSSLKGRFSCLSKRPCVQIKTHLRLRSNVLAFQVKRTCVLD